MGKKTLLSLAIVLFVSLTIGKIYDEKDVIQIDILNEVDIVNGVSALDTLRLNQLDKNDYLYYSREMNQYPDSKIVIYRANVYNNKINLLKEVPEEYKYITALHYSEKDKKIYVGAYGGFSTGLYDTVLYEEHVDISDSYIIKFNEDMEIEQAVKIGKEINNFVEIGDKIYAECNSETKYHRMDTSKNNNDTNMITMHEIDKENLKFKNESITYVIFKSYVMKNGNIIIIKAKEEEVIKLAEAGAAINIFAEIIDKDGAVLSSNEINKVYPYDTIFTELPNGNVVFNLAKDVGFSSNDKIYVYAKNGDEYELLNKNNIKIPRGYNYAGIVNNKDKLGIIVSEVDLYEGKNEILLYDNNLEKKIKKYKIDNVVGLIYIDGIKIYDNKNKVIFRNASNLIIGEINFVE